MNDAIIHEFAKLICSHTGLNIREQDRETLRKKIWTRMKALKFSAAEEYYKLLAAGTVPTNGQDACAGECEWKELTLLLTTSESYFFRDQGQFRLLQNQILPELIERQKLARSLRIWSAGCSTGEEPYSLAILVQEMIPDWEEWQIFILGTDINQTNIEKAKRGIYNSWSFRLADTDLQRRYFYDRQSEWEIRERIRQMVTFRYGNLVRDPFPSQAAGVCNMDLILCRNVFVYFDSQAIATVLDKFYSTLKPGGYLIAAHAELYGQQLGRLRAKVFPESVVYERREDWPVDTLPAAAAPELGLWSGESHSRRSASHRQPLGPDRAALGRPIPGEPPQLRSRSPATSPTPPGFSSYQPIEAPTPISRSTVGSSPVPADSTLSPEVAHKILSEAQTLFQKEAYCEAIQKAKQAIAVQPANFGAYYLMAQAHANLGEYDKAKLATQQAIQINSLSADPYYLLAHIAEEQGDIEAAKMFFKRIIYLAPSSIFAYLELASLYEREEDMPRANKMRTTAFELLQGLPPDATLEQHSQLRASELLLYVKKMLRNHESK
ncbi:CheR family methyltransferase [Kamptonema formosum]|uniref:CheR family methyltransferase n=1 Tax=Kamptonema formosum TaxID=331992 RepID=UPI00034C06E7|nr:protein-glutamate O-methyltransferase CheR [Oscillatoria sp. PCC 10802]